LEWGRGGRIIGISETVCQRGVKVAGAPKLNPCGEYRLSPNIMLGDFGIEKFKKMPLLPSGFSSCVATVVRAELEIAAGSPSKRTLASYKQSRLYAALMLKSRTL